MDELRQECYKTIFKGINFCYPIFHGRCFTCHFCFNVQFIFNGNKYGILSSDLFKFKTKGYMYASTLNREIKTEKCVSCVSIKTFHLKTNCCNKFLLLFLFFISPFCGYSLGALTHEAIIDATWDKSIVPLLKNRY